MLTSPEEPSVGEAEESEAIEVVGPVAGGLVLALALSGLLDDTDLLPHPWWIVILGSAAIVGLLLGARTVRTLMSPPE